MPTVDQRLQLLDLLPDSAVRIALTEAIPLADDTEVDAICSALLERLRPHRSDANAFAAIVREAPRLSPPVLESLEQRCRGFGGLLAALLRDGDDAQRRRILTMALKRPGPDTLPIIEVAFGLRIRSLTTVSGEALRRCAEEVEGPTSWSHDDLLSLDRIVAAALDAWPAHRSDEVLLAAALLSPRPGPRLSAFLADADHPAHFGMRGLLKRLGDERGAPRLKEFLHIRGPQSRFNGIGSPDLLARQAHEYQRRLARSSSARSTDVSSAAGETPSETLRDTLENVRRGLGAADREERLRAIHAAMERDLTGEVELELLSLTASDDSRVAATAIRALGAVRSDSARQALAAAMRHPDARLRANAIEALRPDDVPLHRAMLEEMAQDAANRPRANAIRAMALIDRQGAVKRLNGMLDDRRSMHRISALWVARRTVMTECAGAVARLTHEAAPGPVRERAVETARELLAAMEQSAGEGARDPAASANPASMKGAAGPCVALIAVAPMRTADLLIFGVGIGVAVAAAWGVRRWQRRDARAFGPAWRAYAASLGLRRIDRIMLHLIARRREMRNAIGLLISRGAFERCAAGAVSGRWRRILGPRLDAVRRVVFEPTSPPACREKM